MRATIKIKFEKKFGFQKKPYSLVDGLEALAEIDAYFVENEKTASVFVDLFDTDNQDFGYKGYFELGLGNGDTFLEWLEGSLLNNFPDNHTDILVMIEQIAAEIADQALSEKEVQKEVEKPKKRSSFLIRGVIVFALALFGLGAYYVIDNHILPGTKVEVKTSYEEDLQRLTPEEFASKYPGKMDELAAYYSENQEWLKLKDLQNDYPTVGGAFDLAFYEHDWDKVINTDVTTLSEDRKAMLCFAYLEKNMISEAELLASKLESEELNEALDYAYLRQVGNYIKEKKISDAEKIGKKIMSKELQQEFQESIDSAAIMVEMADLYKEQKDQKNVEMWERRLNDLGTALEERGLVE